MRIKRLIPLIVFVCLGTVSLPRIYDWSMRIGVKSGSSWDSYNYLGVARGASLYFDVKDLPEPPPSASGLRLYFPHGDWTFRPGRYATDIRPPIAEREVYDFVVEAGPGDEVTLFWSAEEVPRVYELTLIDRERRTSIDMRSAGEYVFECRSGGKVGFQVVVERERRRWD